MRWLLIMALYLPAGWNHCQADLGGGVRSTRIGVKWQCHLSESGWAHNDCTPRQVSGRWRFNQVPYDLECAPAADGLFRFDANCRWNLHSKQPITAPAVGMTHSFPGALPIEAQVNGYELHYPGAMPAIGADIIIAPHEQKARFLYQWTAPPAGSGPFIECPVEMEFDDVPEKAVRQGNRDIGGQDEVIAGPLTHRFTGMRGCTIKRARVWDSEGQWRYIQMRLRRQGRRLVGVKLVPRDWVEQSLADGAAWVRCDTVTAIYPDANPESGSVDGHVLINSSGLTWANLWGGSGGSFNDSNSTMSLVLQSDTSEGEWRALYRIATTFDIGAAIGTDTITAGTYSLWATSASTEAFGSQVIPRNVVIISNTALANGDFIAFTDNSTAISTAQGSLATGEYTNWTLNGTWVGAPTNEMGATFESDRTNSEPTHQADQTDDIIFSSADETGTGQDPKLTLTHEAAAATALNTRSNPLGVCLGMHRRMPL